MYMFCLVFLICLIDSCMAFLWGYMYCLCALFLYMFVLCYVCVTGLIE